MEHKKARIRSDAMTIKVLIEMNRYGWNCMAVFGTCRGSGRVKFNLLAVSLIRVK